MLKAAKVLLILAVFVVFFSLCLYGADTLLTSPSVEEPHQEHQEATYQRFEDEARKSLGDCSRSSKKDRRDCLRWQQGFVMMYVSAMTKRDFLGSFYQVGAFSGLWPNTAAIAVPKDPARACAWAELLSLTTGHNPNQDRDFYRFCDGLPSPVRHDAEVRLHEIIEAWNLRVQPPPDGWTPKIAGLTD